MKKIFLATKNEKKIEEIKAILKDFDYKILSIRDGIEIPDVVEDGQTFIENSRKKALEIAKYLNIPTIADDSGLSVEALGNKPGIYSARYAGEGANDNDNNKKLLEELIGIDDRKAFFTCVLSIAKPDGEVISFEGRLDGIITKTLRGERGFGYDPLFYLPAYEKTLAELGEQKNKISHRAKALHKLQEQINKFFI